MTTSGVRERCSMSLCMLWRCVMPIPIVCLDVRLRQFLAAFRPCFSKPQYTYFETVVFALLLYYEARTLSGLLRQVAERRSVGGLSRFLAGAAYAEEVAASWR